MHLHFLDKFVIVIDIVFVKLRNHQNLCLFTFICGFCLNDLIVFELLFYEVVLDPVGPNLLNVVDNHFEILIALLHNDAHDLRDLIIEYVLLVIANEF